MDQTHSESATNSEAVGLGEDLISCVASTSASAAGALEIDISGSSLMDQMSASYSESIPAFSQTMDDLPSHRSSNSVYSLKNTAISCLNQSSFTDSKTYNPKIPSISLTSSLTSNHQRSELLRVNSNSGSRRLRYRGLFPAVWSPIMAIVLLLLIPPPVSSADYERQSFQNPAQDSKQPFQKMIVDQQSGRIYVGGVNKVFELETDLKLRYQVTTGPKLDSIECQSEVCSLLRKETEASLKALAIDTQGQQLLICTSLYQGRCSFRYLYNISDPEPARVRTIPVAANDISSSTVAVLGPGPDNQVAIYVASTTTYPKSAVRATVPSVASLTTVIPNKSPSSGEFSYTGNTIRSKTMIKIDSTFRQSFLVHYINAFSIGNFTYFVARQPRSAVGPADDIQTRIIRVCHQDANFYSYTEIPVLCTSSPAAADEYNYVRDAHVAKAGFDFAKQLGISTEDDVMYLAMSKGDTAELSEQSAICAYSIKQIDDIFWENTKICNNGEALKGLSWLNKDRKCNKLRFSDDSLACGNDANPVIGGNVPVQARPVFTHSKSMFTSVAVTQTHEYTVAFVGTHRGNVKMIVIDANTPGQEYDEVVVSSGRPILPDMLMDTSLDYLLILTEQQLIKLRVQECEAYAKCTDCLAALNPYCGWCPLQNKCTVKQQCDREKGDSARWIPYKDQRCTAITKVVPPQLQVQRNQYLVLHMDNLPALSNKQYSCVFTIMGRAHVTGADRMSDAQVKCPTPQTSTMPAIPKGQHALVATLAVQADNGPEFASTNFTFYDCSSYDTCTGCVQSAYACDWCVGVHLCTAQAEDTCRAQTIVNGLKRVGNSNTRGPSYCPRIEREQAEVYVPAGSEHSLKVHTKSLSARQRSATFSCVYKIEHMTHSVPAKLNTNDEIECAPQLFTYYELGRGNGTALANVQVLWADNKPLDNVEQIRVIVYKCERLATSCGLCVTLDTEHYNCGWCHTNKKCTPQDKCTKGTQQLVKSWLTVDDKCPGPAILDFFPKSGPVEGGTKLTITGINLGRSFSDISEAVRVSGVRCEPVQAEYVVSTRIVCITAPPQPPHEFGREIIIKLGDSLLYANTSSEQYHTVNPSIQSFEPVAGPQSGGTRLTVRGTHLDTGSNIQVYVASVACNVSERSAQSLTCVTGKASRPKSGEIRVKIDNAEKQYLAQHYEYTEDASILSVRPEKSIAAGGLSVLVRGDRLALLQTPRMFVYMDGHKRYGPVCKVDASSGQQVMSCITPNLLIPNDRAQQPSVTKPMFADFGFELDGLSVSTSGALSTDKGFKQLAIYPDPVIYEFDSLRYYREDDHLTINGNHIMQAAEQSDVTVQIGQSYCNVSSVSNILITCKPPQTVPEPVDPDNEHPEILVKIGLYKQYVAGALSYTQTGPVPLLSMQMIVIISVCVIAAVLFLVCLLIAFRRKSTKQERELETYKQNVEAIEMKVASECKEAFAELQTTLNINLFSSDMSLGIPYLPYRDYVAQVLFPNSNPLNHPVLRELEVDPQRAPYVEKALIMFNHLLMNKTFLLSLISTMESNKYFGAKDRVYVGSLLMVILQEKMDYCTDILKSLLADLIEKTAERNYQPKVLFRRSESVAERMLAAWFTFLLHRYLMECAGSPLFMLYWAIKQQVEKGPHDALTHEARYSLSEEKLLRASVEHHEMSVFVIADPGQSVEVPVRVLDCDTITQVKEKCLDALYRTTPYSQRPSANDLDLEWRTGGGGGGRMVLQDWDNTTRSEPGGWKRLNTLTHYKVPGNSSVALVPRQASMYNLSLRSEFSEKSSTFSLKNSPTLTRAFHRENKDPESGHKMYHLVKQHEGNDPQNLWSNKMAREIYLTRLVTVKGTLQRFMEDLLEAIFSTAHRGSALPLAIKYMFDFMDEQAALHGYTDPEVVHTWKSNALPLRFWVNLIKNPHFVFDIPRPEKIEGSLSVVAQTLMDACSTQDHQMTKDSPSSKLLFAKDISNYRHWVDRYYHDIASIPPISDQDMNAFLVEESRSHTQQFHVYSALNELYKFVHQYREQLATALTNDEVAVRNRLPRKLEEMLNVMDGNM